MRALVSVSLLSALVVLAPRHADAGDMNRPSTPAVFMDVPCMVVVDRSQGAVFHIDYDVQMDDLVVPPDEVADGRRLQFFAMRKQVLGAPPNWITRADIEAAMAAPASADDMYVGTASTDAENVLEESPEWASDEWFRITPDDARIPISHEQAMAGIDWDTSGVPQGAYVVWAYTWDPTINAWVQRAGAIKVVDDASDPAAAPPALYVRSVEGSAEIGTDVEISACVDAMPGSTITLSYTPSAAIPDPVWVPIVEDEPVETGDVTIPFAIPEGCTNDSLRIRGVITDPEGRSYTAYAPGDIVTFASDPPDDPPACDEPPPAPDDGCSCTTGTGSEPWWLLVLPLLAPRRRIWRRSSCIPTILSMR